MRIGWGTRRWLVILLLGCIGGQVLFVSPKSVAASVPARQKDTNGQVAYMNVGTGDADIDYQFTAVPYGGVNADPGVHFGWGRAFSGGVAFFDSYKIQYLVQSSQYSQMSSGICSQAVDASTWTDLDITNSKDVGLVRSGDNRFTDIAITPGKVALDIDDARRQYSGNAFFRVIGYHGSSGNTPTVFNRILTCRTIPINAITDSPTDTTVMFHFKAIDGAVKDSAASTDKAIQANVFLNDKPLRSDPLNATVKGTTPTTAKVNRSDAEVTFRFEASGYKPTTQSFSANASVTDGVVKLYADKPGTVSGTTDATRASGGSSVSPGSGGGDFMDCNKDFLSVTPFTSGRFSPAGWIACQLWNGSLLLTHWVTGLFNAYPINTWDFIGQNTAIIRTWKVALSLVDFLVVLGLLVAAFANIFRIKLDTYGIKQILPGLIIGILLANLSFFIMRLFIETTVIGTQVLGIIIGKYLGTDIGASSVTSFISEQTWIELSRSLFITPATLLRDFITIRPGTGTGIATLLFLVKVPAEVGGIAGLILIVLVTFIALILFVTLLFLLYVRHFALITLFILSPLAFFALGFPPGKGMWQKWWGMFWKWLIMLPVSFSVLALTLLFLHFMNQGDTLTLNGTNATSSKSIPQYIFVNAVAIALIYFANRIPFLYGQFFGFNLSEQWAKYGSKTAQSGHTLAKAGGDFAINRVSGASFRLRNAAPPKSVSAAQTTKATAGDAATQAEILKRGAKVGLTKSGGETWDAYSKRVNQSAIDAQRQYAGKLFSAKRGARSRYNLFRYPESFSGGLKERFSNLRSDEEKAIKQNVGYRHGGGPAVSRRADLARFLDEYKELDDDEQLWDDKIKKSEAYKQWKALGGTAKQMREFWQRGDTGIQTALDTDPLVQGMKRAGVSEMDIIEFQRQGKRLVQLIRPTELRPKLPTGVSTKSDIIDYLIDNDAPFPFGLVPGSSTSAAPTASATAPSASPSGIVLATPYTPVSGGGAPAAGSSGTTGFTTQGSSSRDAEIQAALAEAGKETVQQFATDVMRNMPQAAVAAAMEGYKNSEQALMGALQGQGVGTSQAKAIVNNIFTKIQKGIKGVSYEELKRQAGVNNLDRSIVEPMIADYKGRVTALNRSAGVAATEIGRDLPVNREVAMHLSRSGVTAEQLETQLNQKLGAVQSASPEVIRNIHKDIANLAADVRPIDPAAPTEEYAQRIQEDKQRLEGAMKLMQRPEVVAAQQSQDPQQLTVALNNAMNQSMVSQQAVVETAKDRDASGGQVTPELLQRAKERIQNATVEYSPTLKQQYHEADEPTRQKLDDVVNRETQSLVERLNVGSESAHAALNDNDGGRKSVERDTVIDNVTKGFQETLSTPTQSQSSPDVTPSE